MIEKNTTTDPILKVSDLSVHFCEGKKRHCIVDGVSFSVRPGECLGILGESGSGNFFILTRHMLPCIAAELPEKLRRLRGSSISVVLQNPMSCFDPLYRIGDQMEETIAEHMSLSSRTMLNMMLDILTLMRIRDPKDVLRKYPHQLSGGMLQRIMIGLAISLDPVLIIADEPTTAIDSISQFSIMKEFVRIKHGGDVAMIFISHDLGVLSLIADHVIVMHNGRAVERGSAASVFDNAKDPYTHHLIGQHKAVMERFLRAIRARGKSGNFHEHIREVTA